MNDEIYERPEGAYYRFETIDDLIDQMSSGCPFELSAIYGGKEYFFSDCNGWGVSCDEDREDSCGFNSAKEFAEKATVGGRLLKDIVSELKFW